ncbi:MAG: HAMP domain-containing sensor histidine kinase [Proteobacteria bacterium]|nr:HAMP domain-containing sensor histidine kinase [Pseudomonadota bacterium]
MTAQNERQRQAALGVVARVEVAIGEGLATVNRTTTLPVPPTWVGGRGLARYWFWIERDGHLRVPRGVPRTEVGSIDRAAACGSGLEECVRELSTRQARLRKLSAARKAELCADPCVPVLTDARRQFAALAAFTDTGPAAQLGLVRIATRLGDAKAASAALAELERRFADRSFEDLPVSLVVAVLRAQAAGSAALLAVAERVFDAQLDPGRQLGVIARLRPRLGGELPPDLARRRSLLDERVAEIRGEARAAAGLADDLVELTRTATTAWRGKPSAREPRRTLIYQRRADGSIIGFAVDALMLEEAAGHDPRDDVAVNARPVVLPAGAVPGDDVRTIAQVPLGVALPQLSLAIVNPLRDPDPLDEVIRTRSRRHVIYTSALGVLLAVGMLATVRGAARARELAQLKSDFVSTVSHELKTPLTSIRMFAEMLETGVAKGDPTKMARYHQVIVQESQRLGLLIANLLDYAQIEKGTRRYTRGRHAIRELGEHAVATFETLRDPEKGARNPVDVEVSLRAMEAEVEVDRDVVVGAVLNLLANAAKYGGDQPISVAIDAVADQVSIAVRDHGPGIPLAEQPRIFREFYRAPEAYRSGVEGTGLGLALVKRHIEALGGTVDVASTVGEGATFTIRLPRSGEEAA